MANLYLSAGENVSGVTFGGSVFGSTGNESVTYAAGVTGSVVDQNVEQVRLTGNTSDFQFQQQGNALLVFSGATQVARITLQNDANGTLLTFGNGTVEARVSASGMTLGGTTVSSTAPSQVVPTTIDTSGTTPGIGQTLTLTAGVDAINGTGSNETIVGTLSGAAGAAATGTLQSGDAINGGAGQDTLRIVAANGTAQTVIPSLSGVENVEYQGFATVANTLNLASSTGVQNVSLANGSSDLNVTNAASLISAGASNTTGGTLTLAYTGAATAGLADVQNVSLNNAAGTTITVNGVETINLAVTGTNGTATAGANTVSGDSVTAMNISGAGSLVLANALAATTTTLNASANTGGVDVAFTAGGNVAVTGGSGNDTFRFGTGLTAATPATATAAAVPGDVVNGGAGFDTVRVTTGGDLSAAGAVAPFGTLTSIERVGFDGAGVTLSGATFTNAGITNIELNTVGADTINGAGSARTYEFGAANTDAATFNMAAGSTTLNLDLLGTVGAARVDGPTNTVEVGALTITPAGVASATNVTTTTLSSLGNFTVGALVNDGGVGGTNVLSFTAGTFNSVGTITAASGSTLVVDGNAALDIAGFTNNAIVNASALTGGLVIQGSAFVGTAGSAAVGGAGGAATTSTNTGVDTITLGAGRDVVQFALNGSDSGTVQISGTAATAAGGNVFVDVINGFTAGQNGDVLDIAGATATYTALGAPTQTAINGLSGADATLFGAANLAANGNNTEGWTAFSFQGNTYALYEGGPADTTGGFTNADTLVQLSGVTIANLTTFNFA